MIGSLISMANWVMRHLPGYSCNLDTGFEDQLKALNVRDSGTALLFNLILSVNTFDFILPSSLNFCFIGLVLS